MNITISVSKRKINIIIIHVLLLIEQISHIGDFSCLLARQSLISNVIVRPIQINITGVKAAEYFHALNRNLSTHF